jgi:hypothetical protein
VRPIGLDHNLDYGQTHKLSKDSNWIAMSIHTACVRSEGSHGLQLARACVVRAVVS